MVQACVSASLPQPGGDVEQLKLMCKYDVIRKIGSTRRITTLPEEDRATAIGNLQKNFGEDRTRSSDDMIVDRQTHTQTHRDAHHNTPLPYRGAG